MFFNPYLSYQVELSRIFLDSLVKDNDSKYFKQEICQVLEAVLKNKLEFVIKDDVIYEVDPSKKEIEIFKNNKKNADAIYALKILLTEYNHNPGKEATKEL